MLEEPERGSVSGRDALLNRLQSKYPDKQFDDDESFYGQLNDDLDADEKSLAGYREREQQLSDMFTSDPRSASFITDWRKGEDPTIGLIRRFGDDLKDALDDPELQDQIAAANKEYVERVKQEGELEEAYKRNISETLDYLNELSDSGTLSDEEIDDAMELLVKIVHDGIVGKFSPETIDMAVKALHHDSDVALADRAGEVRGRNSKIEEKLRKRKGGDGLAMLGGQNQQGDQMSGKKMSVFDYAKLAK